MWTKKQKIRPELDAEGVRKPRRSGSVKSEILTEVKMADSIYTTPDHHI
jgi:hypothetical protein